MQQPNLSDMIEDKPALNVTDILNYSASLVHKFAKYKLPGGETLTEKLTLEGIPFWDILSAELACYHIPIALGSDAPFGNILCRIRPYLSRSKHIGLDLFRSRKNTIGCSTWPHGISFLCLGFSNYIYRDVLQSVATLLVKHNNCQVVSLSDQPWRDTNSYSHHGHIFQTVWQHWNQQVGEQASKLQKELNLIERDLYASDTLPSLICDDNRCTWNGFQNLFSWIFRARLPRLIQQAVVARHILENHRPALVISPDVADPRARVYTSLCQRMGIPCLGVQFGLTGAGIEWQYILEDKVAVWGETSKKDMLSQKVSEERIVITGSPRYDCLVNVTESEVKAKRSMLGISEERPMVVMASAYHMKSFDKYSDPEILYSMKRSVFEAADKTQGICLVVKPHPAENVRETRALAGKKKNIIFVSQNSDIRDLTRICDAFISFGSTATIDALVAGKLIICPIFPGWVFSDTFKNPHAFLNPDSAEEILKLFQLIANGEHTSIMENIRYARQDILTSWVYRADGMASTRVAGLALQMAKYNIADNCIR